jgi:hypothetical protein
MTLLDIHRSNPDLIKKWNISQIVSASGEGKLRDNGVCQAEFRDFLQYISLEEISGYTEYILENKIEDGGFILQDLINEVGRRLGFQVTNGRYRGVANEIGFDGLWLSPEGALVVEVKTTDAYRINLDTIAGYSKKLYDEKNDFLSPPPVLLVVGRQDTGDLEAQIRGSQHAWSARLIGVAALVKATNVIANIDGDVSLKRFRQSLFPIEYTRVDALVELFFSAASDTDRTIATDTQVYGAESTGGGSAPSTLEKKRNDIVQSLGTVHSEGLKPISKAKFIGASGARRFCVALSKRYERPDQVYWYAVTDAWLRFLEDSKYGYLVLGFEDQNQYCEIDIGSLSGYIPKMNVTIKPSGQYWHLSIQEKNNDLFLHLPKGPELIPLKTNSIIKKNV